MLTRYFLRKEIRRLEDMQDVDSLWDIISGAVESHFGHEVPAAKRHVAVLILDAKGDLRFKDFVNRSSISNGLGIFGSRSLYTLPSCLEEVVSAVCYA